MNKLRYEVELDAFDLEQAERHRAASGLRTRAAYARLCLISGPAEHHPELERVLADVGLLCAVLRVSIEEGDVDQPELRRGLDKLVRQFGQLVRLLRNQER